MNTKSLQVNLFYQSLVSSKIRPIKRAIEVKRSMETIFISASIFFRQRGVMMSARNKT